MKPMYYLLDGHKTIPCDDIYEFGRLYEGDPEKRRVARANLPGDIFVSTVFLGIDHGFSIDPEAQPVLFETMIFGFPEGHELHDYQERYCTWEDAEEGHKRAVEAAAKEVKS